MRRKKRQTISPEGEESGELEAIWMTRERERRKEERDLAREQRGSTVREVGVRVGGEE